MNGSCELDDCIEQLGDIVRCETLCKKFSQKRICQIGAEAYGFLNLREDEQMLEQRLGVKIDHLDVDTLVARAKAINDSSVKEALTKIKSCYSSCLVGENALDGSVRIYLALKELAQERDYLAFAVSCWPELQDQYTMVPCAAFSWLAEFEDIPISCEGDVGGAISMVMLHELMQTKPTLLDLTQLSKKDDALLFWHCGFSPMSLAKGECSLIEHPMLNRRLPKDNRVGTAQDFVFNDGTVTVVRMGGKDMGVLCFEAQSTQLSKSGFTGTRAWLTDFVGSTKNENALSVLDSIMDNGIEHHYALAMGSGLRRLKLFAKANNLKLVL